MPYTNCVSLEFAINELNLFYKVEFKYLKYLLNKNTDYEENFEVEIEDIKDPELGRCMCEKIISFELENPHYEKELCRRFTPIHSKKYITFTKEYGYESGSGYDLIFMGLYEESEDEEDEESEEEEESMSSTDLINELKELFGERVWTRNDEDFLTTAKCEWLENKYIDCVIECEGEYNDLEYYEHYDGTDIFRKLLKKYRRNMEWQTNCIVNIYEEEESEEDEESEEED